MRRQNVPPKKDSVKIREREKLLTDPLSDAFDLKKKDMNKLQRAQRTEVKVTPLPSPSSTQHILRLSSRAHALKKVIHLVLRVICAAPCPRLKKQWPVWSRTNIAVPVYSAG